MTAGVDSMRELTKSIGSFSLAFSLFGVEQLTRLAQRPVPTAGHPTTTGLDAMAQSAENELKGPLKNAYQAGDRLQRSVVELAWGFATLKVLDPRQLVTLSTEVARQSASAATQLATGRSKEPAATGEPCGWGPMPPAT